MHNVVTNLKADIVIEDQKSKAVSIVELTMAGEMRIDKKDFSGVKLRPLL